MRTIESVDAGDITRLLVNVQAGDKQAMNELLPMLYQELKRIAAIQRRRNHASDTMNTTAVVNEAWLRLNDCGVGFENRHHFLAIAATAMKQLLIDEARKQLAQKRGGGVIQFTTLGNVSVQEEATWMLSLDNALDAMEKQLPRVHEVFQLRFFIGLTEQEVAEALDVTDRTVRRDWLKAKAMLAAVL